MPWRQRTLRALRSAYDALPPSGRGLVRRGLSVLDAARAEPPRRTEDARPGDPAPRRFRRIVLDELDPMLDTVATLMDRSEDEARELLSSFELAPRVPPDVDPFSAEYATWTWDLYDRISGRSGYRIEHERSTFQLDVAKVRPFPFVTGSSLVAGQDLIARGYLLTCLGLSAPARIVEFGPGWGGLTIDMARLGHHVTAVEYDPDFCELIEARCSVPENLQVVQGDMLDFRADEPFDVAVFFESFHHCSNHRRMLELLHDTVRPGGRVVFAGEPILAMGYPWGPRLDGMSLWSMRRYGWLELGFDPAYFAEALDRGGWVAERHHLASPTPATTVLIARRRDDPSGAQTT